VFLEAEGGETLFLGDDFLSYNLGFAWESLIFTWYLMAVLR
jgi:hypothetical protein